MRHALVLLAACVGCGGSSVSDPSGTGGGSGGGSGGSGGASGGCAEDLSEWQLLLDAVKKCDLLVDEPQCATLVASHPTCGCSTYVNGANAADIARLNELAQEILVNCSQGPCPIDCANPVSGVCESVEGGGTTGRCKSVY